VLVGDVPPNSNVEPLIQELGLEQDVILTGYVEDMETFLQYMAVTDLALNLRYPTGGETSASLMRLMSLARPVIVSNSGPFAEYPDDCCVKIDADEMEEDALLVMMHVLASDEALRRQIGLNAQRHIQTHHTPEQTAQDYIDFIQDILASPPQPFAVVPPLVEPDEDDLLAGLIADVSTELTDLGIDETDEEMLQEIARTISGLV
jgi:glycosyltransferase involved in cell wall biosynthesis